MTVYPIFLNHLSTKKIILIGGNREAERKSEELLACDANITLISQTITDRLKMLIDEQSITWLARSYKTGDLKGAFIAIVANAEPAEADKIYQDAEKANIPVNVMDDRAHCTFTFGSVVRSGPLTVGISTSGAAPALSVRLRQRFEREFGTEYARLLDFLQSLRLPMIRHYPDFKQRRTLWYELVDSELLTYFRTNDRAGIYDEAVRIIGRSVVNEVMDTKSAESKNSLEI